MQLLPKISWFPAFAAGVCFLLGVHPVGADENESITDSSGRLEFRALMINAFMYRSDTDFDRTEPPGDNGQSGGAFATVFKPTITFHAASNVRLVYEIEVDWRLPQVVDPRHRKAYTEGEVLSGSLGFRTGYHYFSDPTALFIGHWTTAATAWYNAGERTRIGAFLAQIPDNVYEGLRLDENNFKNDILVFGPRTDFAIGADFDLSLAAVGLYDSHRNDQKRWVVAPTVRLAYSGEALSFTLDGVLQVGKDQGATGDSPDQQILAWAAQAHATYKAGSAEIDFNALVLSADDAAEGNKKSGAFLYSSKSRSATILFTEDELHNWYDQFDRRAAQNRGGFFEHRTGFFLADVKATWIATDVFRPALILGAATVLQKANAQDNSFVGVETNLDLEFRSSKHLSGHIVGGALIPGGAGAALLNSIDRTAKRPIFALQAYVQSRF